MKHSSRFFFLLFIAMGIISGCGEQLDMTILKETTTALAVDNTFLESDLSLIESSTTDAHFRLEATLESSFDELSLQKRFNFFKEMADQVREMNKDHNGMLYCGEKVICVLESIDLSTPTTQYSFVYQSNGLGESFLMNSIEVENLAVYEELYGLSEDFVQEELVIELESAEYRKTQERIVIEGKTNLADDVELIINLDPAYGRNMLSPQPAVISNGTFRAVLGTTVHEDTGKEHIPNGTFTIEATLSSDTGEKKAKEIYKTHDHFDSLFHISNGELRPIEQDIDGFEVVGIELGTLTITNGFTLDQIEKKKLEYKKSRYQQLSYAELEKNPSRLKNEAIQFTGEIVQIQESSDQTVIRLAVTRNRLGYSYNDIIWVNYDQNTNYLTGDIVTVYGKVLGSRTYVSQAGWEISIPAIQAEMFEW